MLCPLLFLLYVNDIGNNCVPHTPVKLHADDINVFIHGNIVDVEICLAKLRKWISHNKLSLSIDKTCFSTFSMTDCTRKNIH